MIKTIPSISDKNLRNFENKIKQSEYCWEWTGCKSPKGYGRFGLFGGTYYAHRISYTLYKEPLQEEQIIDHLCKNTSCVNPIHLEPVSYQENMVRGNGPNLAKDRMLNKWAKRSTCKNGHTLTIDNVYVHIATNKYNKTFIHQSCKTCKKAREKARYYRKQKNEKI